MTEPTAVLYDSNGLPMWIAATPKHIEDIHAHIEDIRNHAHDVTVFQLTAADITALDSATGKAAAVRDHLKQAITDGYTTAWMIVPAGDSEPPVPAAPVPLAATDEQANAAIIRAKIEEARSALLARITGGRLRTLLSNPDVYSADVYDALQEDGITPQLMLAATALHWAIGHGQDGDLPTTMTWCARLHEHLATVPDAVDNPADHIRLTWVDNRDEVSVGNVTDLAQHIELAALAGDGQVDSVYVFRAGQPVKLAWEVTGTDFNEEQWATNTVTVTLTDGAKVSESWKVDGAV